MAGPVFSDGSYEKSLKIDFAILDGPQYSIGGVRYMYDRIGAALLQFLDHVWGLGDDDARNTSASSGSFDSLVGICKKWQEAYEIVSVWCGGSPDELDEQIDST